MYAVLASSADNKNRRLLLIAWKKDILLNLRSLKLNFDRRERAFCLCTTLYSTCMVWWQGMEMACSKGSERVFCLGLVRSCWHS